MKVGAVPVHAEFALEPPDGDQHRSRHAKARLDLLKRLAVGDQHLPALLDAMGGDAFGGEGRKVLAKSVNFAIARDDLGIIGHIGECGVEHVGTETRLLRPRAELGEPGVEAAWPVAALERRRRARRHYESGEAAADEASAREVGKVLGLTRHGGKKARHSDFCEAFE